MTYEKRDQTQTNQKQIPKRKPPYSLRECRQLSLISSDEVASHMGISRQTLYYWENGNRLIPLNQIIKLADLYDIPLNHIDLRHIAQTYETLNRKAVNN